MKHLQNNILKGTGPILKPVVQKRESMDNSGYITKTMLPIYFRFLSGLFSQEAKDTREFCRRLLRLGDLNGETFLVKYLKEAYLLTQKYLSGEKVTVTKTLPFSLIGGLPRMIPGPLRSKIREGDPQAIRMVLTSFAVFRILKCPGILKYETITDPFKGLSETLPTYEISQALRSIFGPVKSIRYLPEPEGLFLMSAGPNSSVSWKGTGLDIKAGSSHPLLPKLHDFVAYCGGRETSFYKELCHELVNVQGLEVSPLREKGQDLCLGRLSLKEEAAGKIRVFAITDCVTQALFKPLHDYLFGLLKSIPMDGTFDQVQPLKRLLDLKHEGALGSNKFGSYDLSAATDRLPSKLQGQILDQLFGVTGLGSTGRELLVGRSGSKKTYSVGQPMGALSSWAMLAITQHVLVGIAARRVGVKEFTHYAVLGDDIVIGNDIVAHSYLGLMTETLGVEINLSKSLISDTHFEYAKRLVSVDHEFTPIGPKNLLILLRTPYGLVSVLRDAISKGYFLDEKTGDTMKTSLPFYGKRALRSLDGLIKGPFGLVPTEAGLSSDIRLDNSLTPVKIDMILSSIDQTKFESDLRVGLREVSSFKTLLYKFEVLGDVDTELVMPVSIDDEGLLTLPVGSSIQDYYTKQEKESLVVDDLAVRRRLVSYGIPYGLHDSALYFSLRSSLLNRMNRFVSEKPVRRFIFGGPLIMTNHYRVDGLPSCMEYIRTKIMNMEFTTPILDPFQDLSNLVTSRDHMRGINYFRAVRSELKVREDILRQQFLAQFEDDD